MDILNPLIKPTFIVGKLKILYTWACILTWLKQKLILTYLKYYFNFRICLSHSVLAGGLSKMTNFEEEGLK